MGPSASVREAVVGDVLRRAARLGPDDVVLPVFADAGNADVAGEIQFTSGTSATAGLVEVPACGAAPACHHI